MPGSRIQWIILVSLAAIIGCVVYFNYQKSEKEFLQSSTGIYFPSGTRVIKIEDDWQHVLLATLKIRKKHINTFKDDNNFVLRPSITDTLLNPLHRFDSKFPIEDQKLLSVIGDNDELHWLYLLNTESRVLWIALYYPDWTGG